MKTAKEILHEHAAKNNDGFLSGQIKWLVEAMEEYAKQEVDDALLMMHIVRNAERTNDY